MGFTDENTSGFSAEEIEGLNAELEARLSSDELEGLDPAERVDQISERILAKY